MSLDFWVWFWFVLIAGICITISYCIWIFSNKQVDCRLSWLPASIALAFCAFIVVPWGLHIGNNSLRQGTKFNEFWNGYETAAVVSVEKCERDGSCSHEYDCDPYEVSETYYTTDSDGERHRHTRHVTKYHDCPYVTEEYSYSVQTTLGNYSVYNGAFAVDPVSWSGKRSIPSSVQRGEPELWKAAKARLDASNPGPVTVRKTYDNFILSSQETLLRKFSDDVDHYKEAGLLPALVRNTYNLYQADKVAFVKYQPTDPAAWQLALGRLNGAAGIELQGDIYLVLADVAVIDNPDAYVGALAAYWQSKELGKDALSKNAVVVVVGVDNEKVGWARSFTGMPRGNEGLVVDIASNLKGLPATPDAVLGQPYVVIGNGPDFKDGVKITLGSGAVERALWGPNKFVRVSMSGKDGGMGYKYLADEIELSASQKRGIVTPITIFQFFVWSVAMGAVSLVRNERLRYTY